MMKCSLYMSMTDRVTLAEIRVLEYKNAFWYPPEVVGGWKVHTTLMIAWLVTLPLPLVFQFHSQSAQTALDVWHCLRLGPFREDADCLKIPCRGRGRCVHTTRGFVCQCEAGFTGDTCEGCLSAAVFIHVIDNVSSLFHQHRCGLLLQMSHVPWCVCVLDAKWLNRSKWPFAWGRFVHMVQGTVYRWATHWRHLANATERSYAAAMRPYVKLLDQLSTFVSWQN